MRDVDCRYSGLRAKNLRPLEGFGSLRGRSPGLKRARGGAEHSVPPRVRCEQSCRGAQPKERPRRAGAPAVRRALLRACEAAAMWRRRAPEPGGGGSSVGGLSTRCPIRPVGTWQRSPGRLGPDRSEAASRANNALASGGAASAAHVAPRRSRSATYSRSPTRGLPAWKSETC